MPPLDFCSRRYLVARHPKNIAEDAFTYYQSSHRVHVEQAVGQLVARCRLFTASMRFALHHSMRLVDAGMLSSNFNIIVREVASVGQGERCDLERSFVRAVFIEHIRRQGIVLPDLYS